MGIKGADELKAKLARLGQELPDVMELALHQGAAVIEGAAKELAPYESGDLRRSINYLTIHKSLSSVIVSIGTNLIYARLQEFGGTIEAKNKPYLRFRTKGGNWVTTRSVFVPPHPYLTPAMDNNHGRVQNAIEFSLRGYLEATV